jgi:glyoxylase-like metal-dependent hydrolase (beta-lactamase superfamily II)
MSTPLDLDVFVVPYRPIVGVIAPMGEGEATWPATSVSLISGERDAVLIDAVLTPDDAGRVVDWIRASGKNLTTIYITHGHGDHFFGLNTILAAFPDARAVTKAAVIPEAQEDFSPDLWQFWNAIFPGQLPEHPVVPDALDGDVIDLEGHELRIITVGQSDITTSTIVHIPSLDAVISGDVAYNGIHQWLAQTDHDKRMQWIASVEQIEALEPRIVVASHKRPGARDDDPATILGDTKRYIRDFDESLSESRSAQELVDKMMVLHGDLGNPYTLWTAAQTVFEHGQGANPFNIVKKVADRLIADGVGA